MPSSIGGFVSPRSFVSRGRLTSTIRPTCRFVGEISSWGTRAIDAKRSRKQTKPTDGDGDALPWLARNLEILVDRTIARNESRCQDGQSLSCLENIPLGNLRR